MPAEFPPPGYPAPPSPAAAWVFERYVRRLARRHFAAVHWANHGSAERWSLDIPTLFVANHTNWWDGFLAVLMSGELGLRFQILMEARHLERYRAFRRVGALPLRRDQSRGSYADLTAAAQYLRPGAGLWIFPQGSRRPPNEAVSDCERGAAHLALGHQGPLRLTPVAFRYAFTGEQLPEAFMMTGHSWLLPDPGAPRDRGMLMRAIEGRLRNTVESLDTLVLTERLDAFRPLVEGRLSINKHLDRFRHAVGLLHGPFETRNG
jgi:1-acyl-sn-glycerol-3-phosphate acyltransferase